MPHHDPFLLHRHTKMNVQTTRFHIQMKTEDHSWPLLRLFSRKPLTQWRQQHRRTFDGFLCAAAFVQDGHIYTNCDLEESLTCDRVLLSSIMMGLVSECRNTSVSTRKMLVDNSHWGSKTQQRPIRQPVQTCFRH